MNYNEDIESEYLEVINYNNIDHLFEYLKSQKPPEINLTSMGYFCKILCTLVARRPFQVRQENEWGEEGVEKEIGTSSF
jgi:hypothetical protein